MRESEASREGGGALRAQKDEICGANRGVLEGWPKRAEEEAQLERRAANRADLPRRGKRREGATWSGARWSRAAEASPPPPSPLRFPLWTRSEFAAVDARTLRAAVGTFCDLLELATRTVEMFGGPDGAVRV